MENVGKQAEFTIGNRTVIGNIVDFGRDKDGTEWYCILSYSSRHFVKTNLVKILE